MIKSHTILVMGEILVEFVSHEKNCALAKITGYSGPYPSGAPAIFADQAARVGGHSVMVGGLGADGFGRSTLERLREDRVDVSQIAMNRELSTGVAFVSYFENGSRDFIYHIAGSAAERFQAADLTRIPAPVVLHVSAASLGSPVIRPRILAAMAAVRAAGGRVSCDPNARPELMRDQEARDALTTIIAGSDILLPSTSDLDYLYPGRSETQAIEQLLQGNARIIALKRGSRGAMVIGPDAHFEFAAHPVEELDPTGAGDCFCGTFIALLTRGFSLFEAGRHANTAGALAVTRRGPMEGNTSLETIRAFLARDDRSAAYHTGVSDD